MAIGAAQPAFAGLKINLVYIDNPPLFYVAGGGQLREIMQVAAENWERVFKSGNGNWKLTIDVGWDALRDPTFFAQEHVISEGGNPSRITHSCIIFNSALAFPKDIAGFFADHDARNNSEFLDYASYSINTDYGWLNAGRIFSEPMGDAIDRRDLLKVAMHEIGHALGLDYDFSRFKTQLPGTTGPLRGTPPRAFAGIDIFVSQGPHISENVLMVPLRSPAKDG